jgi:ribosomal-protein-alanine N-acetyltransferase
VTYPTVLETDRLLLRPITRADLDFYARIHADPEVARYLANGIPRTREESGRYIDVTLESYARHGMGQLAVLRKSDNSLIGRCGLGRLELRHSPEGPVARKGWYMLGGTPDGEPDEIDAELGYTFDRAAWGFGYAREASGAVWAHAREVLGVRPVSMIHAENARSLKLARSFGVEFVDQVYAMGRVFERYRWPATAPDVAG